MVMGKLKQPILRILSKQYKRRHDVVWEKESLLHIGIECWPGFTANDWIRVLDSEFNDWQDFVETYFIHNRFECSIISPEMDVYVSTWLTSDLIKISPRLKWVQLLTAGAEFLEDMDIPSELKITTVSGVASGGVAEHAIALMMALDRRIDLACIRQRRWIWKQKDILENIKGLYGRTVGIIGLGNIGKAVAILAKRMDMEVIGMSRHYTKFDELDTWYAPDELLKLLSKSDFVVLCLPLTKETKGIIGRDELLALGEDSYLINVARGRLVDEYALAWALKKRIIAGAALDVLSSEPPHRRHPLRNCPNLIITPHVAGNIYTFREEIKKRFICNLKVFLNGRQMEGLYMPPDANLR